MVFEIQDQYVSTVSLFVVDLSGLRRLGGTETRGTWVTVSYGTPVKKWTTWEWVGSTDGFYKEDSWEVGLNYDWVILL